MASKVQVKDRGYNALLKRLGKARATVTVGIHEEEGSEEHGENGITVAEVAAIHELGLGDQEQRSFIGAWFDENEAQNNEAMRKLGVAVVKGQLAGPDQAMERLGLLAVGSIQKRMSDGGVSPPDKPSTIAKKGSSVPLIDDGILRSKITHKVAK